MNFDKNFNVFRRYYRHILQIYLLYIHLLMRFSSFQSVDCEIESTYLRTPNVQFQLSICDYYDVKVNIYIIFIMICILCNTNNIFYSMYYIEYEKIRDEETTIDNNLMKDNVQKLWNEFFFFFLVQKPRNYEIIDRIKLRCQFIILNCLSMEVSNFYRLL